MNLDNLILRPLNRSELDTAIGWAADEGWNPGLHDAELFWQTDPEGFVGAELDGELVATGSIVRYGTTYGFMGLFIVRLDLRGRGIGTRLWFHRRDLLRSRLDPDAAIGMDGVFDMQPWYAKGGFVFSHRNLRMEGVGRESEPRPGIVPLRNLPPDDVAAYDTQCFGSPRPAFLPGWLTQPDSLALGAIEAGKLIGFGLIRRCRTGCKVGPLFADNQPTAEALFDSLAAFAPNEPLWLDIPENNPHAVALAARYEMTEVFGCARMYLGPTPPTSQARVFGITTFELG